MIIVTGAAGFIGSRVVYLLNARGINNIIAIDRAEQFSKNHYLDNCKCIKIPFGNKRYFDYPVSAVIHIGAISDTLEKEWEQFNTYNVTNTIFWKDFAKVRKIPFVWASSSAIYGNGSGPLNQYATSKLLSEQQCDGDVAALRFFNVYGPNESHKGRMASVIFNWFNQLKDTGSIRVFEQSSLYNRDLIHVDDVCRIVLHMVENYVPGIYDVGTGTSENMEKIAVMLLSNMNLDHDSMIKVPMPIDLKSQYQYNTRAILDNITNVKFDISSIRPLSTGMANYIDYLKTL